MGSVKKLILDWPRYVPPTFTQPGFGVWEVKGGFSVADFKRSIPQVTIKHKPQVLAMTAAAYAEAAANAGFPSTYVGVEAPNGDIVDMQTLLDRGDTTNRVVMKLVATPSMLGRRLTKGLRVQYHQLIDDGLITSYIADCEWIFRLNLPLGSSWFKGVAIAAGYKAQYEQAATYDDTVKLLDLVRNINADSPESGAVNAILAKAGLGFVPNPGYALSMMLTNVDTKFDPSGDKPLTLDEARRGMHLSKLEFAAWQGTFRNNALHQRDYCLARQIHNLDGKVEAAVINGIAVMADFAVTVDENRLTIEYMLPDGTIIYVPANKEIQRAIFRLLGLYEAKDLATAAYGDDWHHHLLDYTSKAKIREATMESVQMMEAAICTVGNMLLGRKIFPARPIAEWVGPFIPFSSRKQPDGPPSDQLALI